MEEQPYKNRELQEKFADIREYLIRIEDQTTKTNGRVNRLEGFQKYIIGFCTAIGIILVSIVIPLISAILSSHQL